MRISRMVSTIATIAAMALCLGAAGVRAVEPASIHAQITRGAQGVPIVYYEWGNHDGPDVLFVHGFLASSMNWQKQIDSDLGERYHLVALDMRGHGSSGKPWDADAYVGSEQWAGDINAVIRAAELDDPVIVAWSYGGLFAMDYIKHHGQDTLSGLVLVATKAGLMPPPPRPAPTPERTERIRRSSAPNMFTLRDWTAGFMQYLTAAGPLPDDDMQVLMNSALAAPHYMRGYLRERPTDYSGMRSELTLPVLFIGGETDASTTAEQLEDIAGEMPNSEVSIFEGQGTMPFWYVPEQFNREVSAFVDRVSR